MIDKMVAAVVYTACFVASWIGNRGMDNLM
jgi:hypothetical protein